ncbi:hypothetical protein [Legionella bononiensis]|uniref:Coiled-coil protein n=1 Tax=Legionella bononiensis TaxID=2793102 RepID=A0ABS1WFX7_9GAMM|nr:hypothetical protein [Legionella bononiensis]MBL7481715.1 hypothetical protein [Legionella bononiensis]MBL7528263.1 hypothetical protein [Legionella bononiensis]MBL7562738.1 hypothetical protein [Legionella bononiensis]
MTIFLKVLIKLIKEKLNAMSSVLSYQSEHPSIYNQLLSLQKKNILDTLESKIVSFVGTGDDEADSKTITKWIEDSRVQIQNKQEEHGKSRDEGDTLKMMSDLIFHTNAFFAKLDKYNKSESSELDGSLKLRLINHRFYNTPENVIYYHAAGYLGEEIFNPSTNIDLAIRTKKEEAVLARIQSLSERIRPEYGLVDRKQRAADALRDLSMDNKTIITPESSSSFGIPFLSFGGIFSVKVPTTLFNPSEGRFGKLFNLADSLVKEMTELEFKPSEQEESAMSKAMK